MTLQEIKAIGFFLATYESDITYIDNFRIFKKGKIPADSFCRKGDHTFYSFLSEYRVTRNFKKDACEKILAHTVQWLKDGKFTDVDGFARYLKNARLTHDKTMTSLASKILFLNCPQKIVPFDNRVKKSVGQDSNLYTDYLKTFRQYKKEYKEQFEKCLQEIKPYATKIEKKFNRVPAILTIRKNRLMDKWLWTLNGKPE